MEDRSIAIIGGIVFFLALLSPFAIENRGKIDRLYSEAETLYNQSDYTTAIEKYSAAKKESKKLFTKTDHIDKDFRTHINIKIVRCYYEIGNSTQDRINHTKALNLIGENLTRAKDRKHLGELQHLKALINYKTGIFDVALSNMLQYEEKHVQFNWHPEIIYTIGDIYYKQEKYENALEYFQKLIMDYPNSELCNLANIHIEKIIKILPKPIPQPEPKPIPPWEKEAKRILDRVNALKEQAKTDEAMEQYQFLIDQYPESQYVTFAYEGKGDIYFSAKNYSEARANYEEAIYKTSDGIRINTLYQKYHNAFPPPEPLPPPLPGPLYDRWTEAVRLMKLRKYFEAAVIFEKLIDIENTYVDKSNAHLKASECYYRAYKEDELEFGTSVDALQKLIDNHTDSEFSIQAFYFLAVVYLNEAYTDENGKSHYLSVIRTVSSAEEEYSESDDILTKDLLGRMKLLKEKALKEKTKENIDDEPIQTVPQPIDPIRVKPEIKLVEQGYVYFENKELNKALEKAKEALKINPEFQRAKQLRTDIRNQYLKSGTKHLTSNNYDEAVNDLRKALIIDPNTAYAYCNLGVVYIYMGKYKDAITELQSALMINKEIKEVYFNLALAYYELKEYNKANRKIKKALEIDPKYANATILMDSIDEKLK